MVKTINRFLALSFLALCVSCGGDDNPPTLSVDIFGYGPDFDGTVGFVSGLPEFEDATEVQISVTQPFQKRVLSSERFSIADRNASLPEVAYGENLRMEMEILNSTGQAIAWGGSPLFDFEPGLDQRTFRVQVGPVNGFSPVGSVVVDRETQLRKFAQSRFDYRATAETWLGRAGHVSAKLSDGRVLIAGGGQFVPGSIPSAAPAFDKVYNDIQIFDPETGYFTDLSLDEAAEITGQTGRDELITGVVHAEITPVGNDKFVLTGGFTLRDDGMVVPSNSIQIIDLEAEPGVRVQRLADSAGTSKVLRNPRAFHTATYRPGSNNIVVAGGMGAMGETDILNSVEVINLDSGEVTPAPDMAQRRAEHTAVLMGDTTTIWIVGGRNATQVHASSEIVTFEGSTPSIADGPRMQVGRFGHAATRLSPGNGNLLFVVGGFTTLEGDPTGRYEVSTIQRETFQGTPSWSMTVPRGRATIHELPVSNDIVVVGGADSAGSRLTNADRLSFQSLESDPPYSAAASADGLRSRYLGTTELLGSGHVLIVGGVGVQQGSVTALDSADYYTPFDPVSPPPSGDVVNIE